MLGQETPRRRVPTSAMSRDQARAWARADELAEQVANRIAILRIQSRMGAAQWFFAQQHDLEMANPAEQENQLIDLETRFSKVRSAMRGAEDHRYAVRFTNGDLDIVDIQNDLGGVFLVIIAVGTGAVIIAGLVAGLMHYKDEADDLRRKYKVVLGATDQVFCKDGSAETCAEWKQYKKDSGYTAEQGLVDKLENGLKVSVETGAKWGLGIAIPLLTLAFLWSQRKR